MQTCEKCTQKFTFQQVLKSFWKGYKNINCTNCNISYKHALKNRILGGTSVGIGTFIGAVMMSYSKTDIEFGLLIGLASSALFSLLSSSILISFSSFVRED
jgi:CXXC-20-CXXC protein